MPALSLSVPNPLGQQEASQRLKSFLAKLKEHYQDKVSNLEEEWPDENHLKYRFKTFGFDIQGEAKVEPPGGPVEPHAAVYGDDVQRKDRTDAARRADSTARLMAPLG